MGVLILTIVLVGAAFTALGVVVVTEALGFRFFVRGGGDEGTNKHKGCYSDDTYCGGAEKKVLGGAHGVGGRDVREVV